VELRIGLFSKAYLAGVLLLGLAVKEGLEAWLGEGCGCVSVPPAVVLQASACDDDCCRPPA
jgi:hypothetical protein